MLKDTLADNPRLTQVQIRPPTPWQTLAESIADPDYELTIEDLAIIRLAVAARIRAAEPVDPLLAALVLCLSRQAEDAEGREPNFAADEDLGFYLRHIDGLRGVA